VNRKFLLDSLSATLHFFVIYNFEFQVGTLNGHEVLAAIDVDDFALGLLVAPSYYLNEVSLNDVPSWYWLLGYFVCKHPLSSLKQRCGFEASKIT